MSDLPSAATRLRLQRPASRSIPVLAAIILTLSCGGDAGNRDALELGVQGPNRPPFAERMVLNLADLSSGALVQTEGYLRLSDEASQYLREFNITSGDAGSSRGLSLTSSVSVYADSAEAAIVMQARVSGYTGREALDVFRRAIRAREGREVVAFDAAESSDLGEGGVIVRYAYSHAMGDVDGVIVNVIVARAIGTLTLEGRD